MRILESAIITLSSSSGRGGQKSCTHFGGQEHSPLPFFCEGRPNMPKERKKTKNKHNSKQFCFRAVSCQKVRAPQQRATFGLNLKGGWRPFQPRKKKDLKKSITIITLLVDKKETPPAHTTRRRRRKYLSFPRIKHARKKSL